MLVEVTGFPVFQVFLFYFCFWFFGGGKHRCWRGWWEVTYSLEVRTGQKRRKQRRRWSRPLYRRK
jgi:hypothetical protein